MTKVFIGGSRRISRINADVKQRIERVIEKHLPVLVGDANGADKAVQEYLRSKSYDLVEVFCSGESCRNNTGGWPVRAIPVNGKRKDFSFYATKDRAMADEASVGLMLWDKKSVGTLMNVLRLIRQGKKVVVYISPEREFVDLKGYTEWNNLLSRCPSDLRKRIDRETSAEEVSSHPLTQGDLFEAQG